MISIQFDNSDLPIVNTFITNSILAEVLNAVFSNKELIGFNLVYFLQNAAGSMAMFL